MSSLDRKAKDVRFVLDVTEEVTGTREFPYQDRLVFQKQVLYERIRDKLLVGSQDNESVWCFWFDDGRGSTRIEFVKDPKHERMPLKEADKVDLAEPFKWVRDATVNTSTWTPRFSAFVRACFIMAETTDKSALLTIRSRHALSQAITSIHVRTQFTVPTGVDDGNDDEQTIEVRARSRGRQSVPRRESSTAMQRGQEPTYRASLSREPQNSSRTIKVEDDWEPLGASQNPIEISDEENHIKKEKVEKELDGDVHHRHIRDGLIMSYLEESQKEQTSQIAAEALEETIQQSEVRIQELEDSLQQLQREKEKEEAANQTLKRSLSEQRSENEDRTKRMKKLKDSMTGEEGYELAMREMKEQQK